MNGLEALAGIEYPGRFIIAGKDVNNLTVVVYGLTGRSQPSRARQFLQGGSTGTIRTDVTDPAQLEKGSPALLLYPAIAFLPGEHGGFVASNGAQTKLIYSNSRRLREAAFPPAVFGMMRRALDEPFFEYDSQADRWIDITTFEPDKYNTPRINLIVLRNNACLHIVRKGEGGIREDRYHDFALRLGVGKFISTYSGINEEPLPSFTGAPLNVELTGASAEETAHMVYNAFAPASGKDDLRVSVVAIHCKPPYDDVNRQAHIINRYGRVTA